MNRLIKNADKKSKKTSAQLIGVGLDQIDGHKRITQAEHFSIVGGSQETHERMTETVVKTFEALDRRGKNLDQVDTNELKDIIKDSTPK
jgi:hypothetical protein